MEAANDIFQTDSLSPIQVVGASEWCLLRKEKKWKPCIVWKRNESSPLSAALNGWDSWSCNTTVIFLKVSQLNEVY